jgi:acetolactate synthase-1/3 small subunit
MLTPAGEPQMLEHRRDQRAVLELTVNNHPGVMSHVCSLFSRRVFNVEGILCMPIDNRKQSRIWLLVDEDQRLEQMMKQLLKLEDVLDVRRHSADHEVFVQLEQFFRADKMTEE